MNHTLDLSKVNQTNAQRETLLALTTRYISEEGTMGILKEEGGVFVLLGFFFTSMGNMAVKWAYRLCDGKGKYRQ